MDIETKLPKMNTESLLLNCSLNNAVVSVSGESYIGGFAGGLANASTVNCNVKSDNALTVTASEIMLVVLQELHHLDGLRLR